MKTSRPVLIAVGLVLFIAGSSIWEGLTKSRSSTYASTHVGNLRVMYSWHERGILAPQVDWVIVAPGELVSGTISTAGVEMVLEFNNGTEAVAPLDTGHLIWIDANGAAEVSQHPATMKLVRGIETTSAKDVDAHLESAEAFVRALATPSAEQVDADQPTAAVNVTTFEPESDARRPQ